MFHDRFVVLDTITLESREYDSDQRTEAINDAAELIDFGIDSIVLFDRLTGERIYAQKGQRKKEKFIADARQRIAA
jgi:hypothetical protein